MTAFVLVRGGLKHITKNGFHASFPEDIQRLVLACISGSTR